ARRDGRNLLQDQPHAGTLPHLCGHHRVDAPHRRRHRGAPEARLEPRDGPGRDPAARAGEPGRALRLGPLPLGGGERPSLKKPAPAKPRLRRSWLFVAGADEAAHRAAGRSGADAIILELEDFTPPELRPKARALAAEVLDEWRATGALAGVRINPLESCGRDDLVGVLAGRPDFIMMSKVESPAQVKALEADT